MFLQHPKLAVSDGVFKKFLTKNVPIVRLKYWPTIWCMEGRLQTLTASILRNTILPTIDYRR